MKSIESYKEQLELHAENLKDIMRMAFIDANPEKYDDEDHFVAKMCEGVIDYFLSETTLKGKNKVPRALIEEILLEIFDKELREFYQSHGKK